MESCGLCLYLDLDQLLPKLNELKIKELWPSSPQQVQYYNYELSFIVDDYVHVVYIYL